VRTVDRPAEGVRREEAFDAIMERLAADVAGAYLFTSVRMTSRGKHVIVFATAVTGGALLELPDSGKPTWPRPAEALRVVATAGARSRLGPVLRRCLDRRVARHLGAAPLQGGGETVGH
jgi:hypothetical protein